MDDTDSTEWDAPEADEQSGFVSYEDYLAGVAVADAGLLRRYRMLEALPDLCRSDDEEAAVFLIDGDAQVMSAEEIAQAYPVLADAPAAEVERLRALAAELLQRGWAVSALTLN